MRDDDRLLDLPEPEFGSGVVGVCDVCGTRQAVVVLSKERFRLCVLDFLNKTWLKTDRRPGAPAPIYRSERTTYPTTAVPSGSAPAIVLSPTKVVRRPAVLIAPDVFGITTTLLDAGIRFAREGFEVILPDLGKTDGVSTAALLGTRSASRFRGGVSASSKEVVTLVRLYRDALDHVLGREMVDPARAGLFGTALGGSIALALAAESTRPAAVALAYPLPVRPADLAKLVTAPILCVVGSADRAAQRAAAQLRSSGVEPAPTVVEVAKARAHFLARDLPAYDLGRAEEGWSPIVEFLRGRLMPAPPKVAPPPSRPSDPLAAPGSTTGPRSAPTARA